MSIQEIHKGDIGTAFRVRLLDDGSIVNISTASTLNIIFQKPGRIVVTKAASLVTDGADGNLQYVTQANDLDEIGLWRLQVYIIIGSSSWHSDLGNFKVYENLD